MGVRFVRGRVAKVEGLPDGNVKVTYEDIDEGKVKTAVHDLVVLSVGLLPNIDVLVTFNGKALSTDDVGFIRIDPTDPVKTNVEGVFAAGCVTGPKDIPDTILEAAAAASRCAAFLREVMGDGRR
jgi:Heterodisulfide reductase, subunit A and related polyferredoxins